MVCAVEWTLSLASSLPALVGDVEHVTVFFAKSRCAIAGTLNKFQIPAQTYRGHCISGTATLPAMMQTSIRRLHTKWIDADQHQARMQQGTVAESVVVFR